MRRLLVSIIGLALTASTAGAYYHFIRYTSRTAPFNPIAEKFDLNALPNKTVTFFVSDSTASQLSRADYFPSALSAIREAAKVWNNVETSDLRVAFGGLASANTPQNTPGADIVFDEMDPLTLGITSTNAKNTISVGPGGLFVPITRPLVRLNRNLSSWNSPAALSFTEAFFLTVAHEMGHALGLQHTFTASLMSTEFEGRATSLSAPLTTDDIAGISYLYPGRTYGKSTGSIAGRITFPTGQGIHMASVVAIRPTGLAISALTDLDGRYRIDGVPPGAYFIYTHPVPAPSRAGAEPGDLRLPLDLDTRTRPADGPFETLFYRGGGQGTRDYSQAQTVVVSTGATSDGINFTLNRRTSYGISSVAIYSYFDQRAVRPGFLNGDGRLAVSGSGLTSNGLPAAGLSVSFLGGGPILKNDVTAYSGVYLALDLALDLQAQASFGSSGPRHVVFSLPNDLYVLPSGLNVVQTRPPLISSVAPGFESNGSRSVSLNGTMLNSETRFYFDGVPATLLHFDDATKAVVAPPAGLAGLRPIVTAFNPDGQNSMFLQAGAPPSYTYDSGDAGVAIVSGGALQTGTESLVEITGTSGSFVEGQTLIGFGSSDVQVRRVWVLGPNKIWANIWVAPNAAIAQVAGTVITGFQVITQASAIQVVPLNSRTPVLTSQIANATPNLSGVYPGATVTLSGSNLGGVSVTVADRSANVLNSNAGQVTFVIPPGLALGPAVVKVSNGLDTSSIAIAIEAVPADVRNALAPGDNTFDFTLHR